MAEGQFEDASEDIDGGVYNNEPRPRENTSASFFISKRREQEDFDDGYDGYDDEDDNYFYDDNIGQSHKGKGNVGSGLNMASLSDFAGSKRMNLSHTVNNSVTKMQQLEVHKLTKTVDKNDRATTEQVLDPRTRLILFKLLNAGFLQAVDGCLSTGKEANVYYAKAGSNSLATSATAAATGTEHPNVPITEYAVKIYKTSILVFKDRDRYVSGEHRWRKGYCKQNPRKMVQTWAEKELRNYRRIHQAGIPCPCPVLLKQHVLIMEFLGEAGWPSPRLKDAVLTDKRLRQAYVQVVLIMRNMYQRCKLVHGDLSEYNLLWHNQQIYVIDVSQSVENSHPSALDFLRKDCSNVNAYFEKVAKLQTMSVRQLFEFITVPLKDDTEETALAYLDDIMVAVQEKQHDRAVLSEQDLKSAAQQEAVDESVFMSSFLPRSLHQMAEYDIQKLEAGDVEETYAVAVASLTGNQKVVEQVQQQQQVKVVTEANTRKMEEANLPISKPMTTQSKKVMFNRISYDENAYCPVQRSESDSDDENSDSSEGEKYVKIKKTAEQLEEERAAAKADRKAAKKEAKQRQSEKRKTKIKKKDKKRAINKSKAGNRKHR